MADIDAYYCLSSNYAAVNIKKAGLAKLIYFYFFAIAKLCIVIAFLFYFTTTFEKKISHWNIAAFPLLCNLESKITVQIGT